MKKQSKPRLYKFKVAKISNLSHVNGGQVTTQEVTTTSDCFQPTHDCCSETIRPTKPIPGGQCIQTSEIIVPPPSNDCNITVSITE